MTRLYLTSLFSVSANVFGHYERGLAGKTVTFIPTASLPEPDTGYVELAKQAFAALGMALDVLEITTTEQDAIRQRILANDYIYVAGGNTFFLLQELKRSGTDSLIVEQVRAGKPYIGESAGSAIVAPSIAYVRDMDDASIAKELASYESLNLIDFYPLPHFGNAPYKEAAERILLRYADELALMPFSNDQLLVVNEGHPELLGGDD
ncbi:MAG: Type 1 glutamine amidotransferase-like domain-containing protein [Pseudomonadota bacterium]